MWVSGSTSSMSRATTSSMTSWRGDRAEGVEDGLRPRAHLVGLGARQVAELLAADRVQRAEDDDLAVLAALHHGSPGPAHSASADLPVPARPPSETMPIVGVEQQVEGDPLLGAAPAQAEHLPVAAHQLDLLVRRAPGRARC